jgi:Tfp pilus assembly protein PilX
MNMSSRIATSRRRQSGISLFPALMFLLVLAVLGISALNSTLMQ